MATKKKTTNTGKKTTDTKKTAAARTTGSGDATGGDSAPLRRQCGAMSAHFRLLESEPSFRLAQAALEKSTKQRMARGADAYLKPAGPMKIKVVVHVVYNTPEQNISTAQIKSQIAVLNRDFRAKNTDKSKVPGVWKGFVGDCNIEFELATKDPKGKATDGITRTQTARTSFGTNDAVKMAPDGIAPWATSRYLNLWVCPLRGGLLGYAQFPGGPSETDGVVINYQAFGTNGTAQAPFNLGRTATHEIGHFLNLRHIWGDTEDCSGTDFVNDTPNAVGPNEGKPVFPHITCGNGPNGDMFVNYMDYSDDDSMFMFTLEQVARMHATIDGARASLVG